MFPNVFKASLKMMNMMRFTSYEIFNDHMKVRSLEEFIVLMRTKYA
jgi:hypothetical protein